ncbi:MAG: prolipoprotein diacylglyceryl transferase [Oscillospiraceae bacterium]|nr:prolipoprotein diacylglyceryl transferase [Oscillospiraceae bacterium]
MTETVSFPGLGLDLEISRVAFYIGGSPIYWYGILISVGLLAACLYFFSRTKEFAVDPDRVSDVLLVTIISSVLGSRLYYVAFSRDEFEGIAAIFNIRQGGLAIYGAIIFAIFTGLIMCKIRRIKFLPAMDLASGGFLIGQTIGRWGNFTNHEAFGSNTSLPWGMTSPSIVHYLRQNRAGLESIGMNVNPDMPVHPTFLYESLWCAAGFLFLYWFTTRRRFDGQLTLIYLGWYGLGRFFIEGLRTDSLLLGSLKVSQMLAFLCFLASAVVMTLVMSKIKREGDPSYLQLYRDTQEGKLVLAGEFYPKKDKNKKTQTAHEEGTAAIEEGADPAPEQTDEGGDAARRIED